MKYVKFGRDIYKVKLESPRLGKTRPQRKGVEKYRGTVYGLHTMYLGLSTSFILRPRISKE